jgi:hypothetical protein
MRGAVVDDPVHPFRADVGLAGHDLFDQFHERHDAGGLFTVAEDFGPVDVVGGQVGQGSAAPLGVVDAHRAGPTRSQRGTAATTGLDGGLLIRGDDVLVFAERGTVENTGVQIQDSLSGGAEVRVAEEDPGAVLPGLERVGLEPAAHRGGGDRVGDGAGDGLARELGDEQRESGAPDSVGN